jgi:hypothetical protein
MTTVTTDVRDDLTRADEAARHAGRAASRWRKLVKTLMAVAILAVMSALTAGMLDMVAGTTWWWGRAGLYRLSRTRGSEGGTHAGLWRQTSR